MRVARRFRGGGTGDPASRLHAADPSARHFPPGMDGWARTVVERFSDGQRRHLAALDLGWDCGARPWQNPDWRDWADARRGDRRVVAMVHRLLAALADAVPWSEPAATAAWGADARPLLVCEPNAVIAANVVWLAAHFSSGAPSTPEVIGAILRRALTEPWSIDSARLRNACIGSLAKLATAQCAEELVRTAPLASAKAQRAQILYAIDLASRTEAVAPSKVAELRVPRHGLADDWTLSVSVHHRSYTLEFLPTGQVAVREFIDADVPEDEHARKVVGKHVREIRATYVKEVGRIEELLATERTWPVADWRRLYLDHPITRAVTCRLVWRVYGAGGSSREVIPSPRGGLYAVDGRALGAGAGASPALPDDEAAMVELWHPGSATVRSVAAWRALLPALRPGQPFPQIARQHTRRSPAPDETELSDYAGLETDRTDFEAAARALHWKHHGAGTADGFPSPSDAPASLWIHEYPDAGLVCAVPVRPPRDGAVQCGPAWFHRLGDRHREPVPLGSLPDRVHSEALRALAVLAGTRLADGDIEDDVSGWTANLGPVDADQGGGGYDAADGDIEDSPGYLS